MRVFQEVKTIKRTSIRMPRKMLFSVDESMVLNGYNQKEKSKWISNAILNLEKMPAYSMYIEQCVIDADLDEKADVTLTTKAQESLDKMMLGVNLSIKNSDKQSRVIRAAIIQYLIKDLS